jgi:hypothetical protein
MTFVLNHPLVLFLVALPLLWIASRVGTYFRNRSPDSQGPHEGDFGLILGATLTLLGLIIGFTFSMAVGRYDQRKNYEEQEANAIGTEYVRLDLLPAADAAKTRDLLREYLGQRIVYYSTRDSEVLRHARAKTAQLESNLWSAVSRPQIAQPSPISAVVLSGMNDVLNSEGYTEAAWRNRVPLAAWILLVSIAVLCNFLLGYRAHRKAALLFLVLPIALSISFFLIADIDSPRSGVIRVHAENLESLADSLRPAAHPDTGP